uniref:Syntaxin-16 n=1 Tax=Romanomermis culicivorax TaxID=13658 RepID=A0A915JE27_ROMCU
MGTEVLLPAQTLGSTRSITEVFILLRNNAMQSKHMYADSRKTSDAASKLSEDRLSLIPLDDGSNAANYNAKMPPEWVNIVDEVQYEILRVQNRMKDLKDLQQRHVNQPSFSDEKSQDERTIEIATAEITKMLSHCHKLAQFYQMCSVHKIAAF